MDINIIVNNLIDNIDNDVKINLKFDNNIIIEATKYYVIDLIL